MPSRGVPSRPVPAAPVSTKEDFKRVRTQVLHMRQGDLARLLRCSQARISYIETGKRRPGKDVLEQLQRMTKDGHRAAAGGKDAMIARTPDAKKGRTTRRSPRRQTELTLLYGIKEAAQALIARDPAADFSTLAATVTAFLSWEARHGGDRRFGPR